MRSNDKPRQDCYENISDEERRNLTVANLLVKYKAAVSRDINNNRVLLI